MCFPSLITLYYGRTITPYLNAQSAGRVEEGPGGRRLVLPNGISYAVRDQGFGYATVEVPFKQFQFGQSAYDTAPFRLPGMIAHKSLLEKLDRDGLDHNALLRENGSVSIADAHHRTLALALRDAFGRLGRSNIKPGEPGFNEAAAAWAEKYVVPLLSLHDLPHANFEKNSQRLARRMRWIEEVLGESKIPVSVPVWRKGVPLAHPTPSWYGMPDLLFAEGLAKAQMPSQFPRAHPSVAYYNKAQAILDLLDRDYPLN